MDEQFTIIEEQTKIRIKEWLEAAVEHSRIHLEIILEDIVERYRIRMEEGLQISAEFQALRNSLSPTRDRKSPFEKLFRVVEASR